MVFLSFCLLASVVIFLFWIHRVLLAKKTSVALIVLFLFVGQGWLPFFLLTSLQTESRIATLDWKSSNVIIILGAGVTQWSPDSLWTPPSHTVSRVFEAARLYRLCAETKNECLVLASGGDPGKKGKSEAAVIKQELIGLGVPESVILMESKSRNTFENAQYSQELLREKKMDQAVLVTSGFHLKRASLYFSHFGLQVIAAPSDRWTTTISLVPKAQNFVFSDVVINEHLGFLRYRLHQIWKL